MRKIWKAVIFFALLAGLSVAVGNIYGHDFTGVISNPVDRDLNYLTFDEGAAQSTPDSGQGVIYLKNSGVLVFKNDDGTEIALSGMNSSQSIFLTTEAGDPLTTETATVQNILCEY